jgi:WbqC-like protein family/NeuB family
MISGRTIGPGYPPFVIAEMSGNHNKSLDPALAIVDAAADAGAHAIKMQTYTADTLTLDVGRPEFTIDDSRSLWAGRSLHSLYAEAYTPWEWHKPILKRARGIAELLGLTPEHRVTSELPVTGAKGDLVLEVCRQLGAARYCASAGYRGYLEPMIPQFRDAGVEVVFEDWIHPTYPQRGEGFTSHLSVIDALMNVGPAAVRDMVKGGTP